MRTLLLTAGTLKRHSRQGKELIEGLQRVIELWFDSVEAIDMAFVSRQGKELIEGLQQQGVTLDWVAMRNQELFFSFDADQPMEE